MNFLNIKFLFINLVSFIKININWFLIKAIIQKFVFIIKIYQLILALNSDLKSFSFFVKFIDFNFNFKIKN